MNTIVEKDLEYIWNGLTSQEKEKLHGAKILLTGCGGFLGFYLMNFFCKYADELKLRGVIGLDNFIVGYPGWLEKLCHENTGLIELHKFDIAKDRVKDVKGCEDVDYVYHMASIASPVFYRKYPIETLDANIWGLRELLEFYKEKNLKGFIFFSSSEIYGDPFPEFIPTAETYLGNVSSIGPRACYDESKRFGETMCYLFNQKYGIPIVLIRPFNNYGPGMRINDKRVPADFAYAIYENRDLAILSDGTPTRTFCYIADAITGYLKGLVYGKFDYFNIGINEPEISIRDLADIYQRAGKEIMGYTGQITFETSAEKDYLTNNPNRRCPVIDKARDLLGYAPQIYPETGVSNFLQYIKESKKEDIVW